MIILLVGICMLLVTVMGYAVIGYRKRETLAGLSWSRWVTSLISHLPDGNTGAGPHIVFGVMLLSSIAISATGAVMVAIDKVGHKPEPGVAVTIGSALFSVFLSCISFWTLWQTRRIEEMQGFEIDGFPRLIKDITNELEKINKESSQGTAGVALDHHRFLLITTNPYFGQLSFPKAKFTREFASELKALAAQVKEGRAGSGPEVKFQVLCGNSKAIQEFNRRVLNLNNGENELAVICNATEKLIRDIEEEAGEQIFFRADEIPQLQFAVVGNTIFEFILSGNSKQSDVYKTRRIRELTTCNRFVQTFDVLKKALAEQKPAPPEPTKVIPIGVGSQGAAAAPAQLPKAAPSEATGAD